MNTHDSIDLVNGFWREVWQTQNNVDAADKFISENVIVITGGGEISGRESFKAWLREFQSQISELKFEIVNTFQSADGTQVSARFRIRGLNNGLLGFPADQRPIEFTGNAIWHIGLDGLMDRNWVERSAFELFRELKGMSSIYDPLAIARK